MSCSAAEISLTDAILARIGPSHRHRRQYAYRAAIGVPVLKKNVRLGRELSAAVRHMPVRTCIHMSTHQVGRFVPSSAA